MAPSVLTGDQVTTLGALLWERREAIAQRWLDGVLATYPEDGAVAFRRQQDPFANPVGHHLRVGTREIVEALLEDDSTGRVDRALHDIIKIRAVQQFTASEAVSFIFGLKEAIETELAAVDPDLQLTQERTALGRRIDEIALTAFDIYTAYREQVCELRINDVKRNVSRIWERMNQPVADRASE